MDIQKDINKEVLKSDEEKVEDLAKDAEDLEKAVEKDIEDKVEKAEEVNDAKAEPLDAKDGSGKAVKDVVASDKEFKEEQEREDVEFPEVKKSEFVTEKLKPFTEKLELNEAAETQTEIKELLSDYLLNELEESEFMDNLAWRVEHDVPGYNHDWCAEEASSEYKEKEYEFIDELVEDLMAMCPLEESLKENKLNESGEEDLRKDANSLSDYLSKNKLYCDLEDYEMYPLGVKVVTFRVEGDWKHDHWYFNTLVEKWAKENGKEIWKIDENTVDEDGSDYYTADHKVYITDKETSDRLNSMRGLFAPKGESIKEDLNSSDLSKFSADVYDALGAIGFEYEVKKHIDVTEKDWDYALRRFKELFFVPSPDEEESLDESIKEDLSVNEKRDALDKINTEGGYAAHDLENIAKKYQPDAKSLNDLTDEVVEKVYSDMKNDFFNKLKIYGDDADLDNILYDVFNANESLKEDLMSNSWGSNFISDVYNALSDIAFKYYRKDINITDDDWNEAIEWFMTHFFESDDNPFYESLKESAEKFIITKVGDNKYALAKGNPPVVNARKTITAKSPEEAKQILVDSGWYSDDELVIESLDESKLDEAIPREVAQALKNSSGQEIKNSGGAYYRIPGSTDGKYQYLDPKKALANSRVDYANAEFNKISKEEAFNLFKNEPQNLLLIVKDYGTNSDKAIWFDENGNRSGRVENVPLEIAPVRRDGEPIRDTKYMTPKQLIGCASACYWTNQREVLRDPDVEKERRQNPESKYYSGDSVSDVVKATSPKYRDSYGIDNRSYRGLKMPSSYNWGSYEERSYQRAKTDLNTWQTKLDSGELSSSDRLYALRKINELENKLKDLEKNRSKYYNDIKDYKANVRNLTMLKSKDYLKKLLDLRAKVKDSDNELRSAEARLATVRNQGGTWSNSYDRRQVARYESQIEELKAQIARYQKYIEDLNAKLSSQQVSEEDAREIANAEADVNRIKSEIEGSKNELDAVLNRARARRQQNTESLEEDLKVTIDFASFEPWGRAEDTYNRIKDAGKLDEADAILEELYPEGISEDSLNAILAHEPEWLLNELGLADEEEVAMLDLDEE